MSDQLNREIQRRELMLNTPIPKLVIKMAIPTVIAMLISSVYNLADTFFVSHLGTSATAAVGVNNAIDQAIMMAGSFLAIGANSYIARLLGAKQADRASRTLSTAFFTSFFLGVIVMIGGLMFLEPLVVFLGATETSKVYAVEYARYILPAAPLMASSFVMNQCLRSEGSATLSMIGMVSGAILNIGLDPIFIFTLDMGVAGAAIATSISKLVSFVILIYPYVMKKSVLRLSFRLISFYKDIVREVSLMGAPSLLRMGLSVVAGILLNNLAGDYSDSVQAAVSVVTRIMMIPGFATLGFGQGFMPVAGYNWGAKRYDRVKESFRFSSIFSFVMMALVSLVMIRFADPIIMAFTESDMDLAEVGSFCLISQCAVLAINAWVVMINMLYSALGRPVGAIILGISRQGICFIPLFFILPPLFGVYGLAATQAVADVVSFLIAIPFAVSAIKLINKTNKAELKSPQPLWDSEADNRAQ